MDNENWDNEINITRKINSFFQSLNTQLSNTVMLKEQS
jgi:hypothetical protein